MASVRARFRHLIAVMHSAIATSSLFLSSVSSSGTLGSLSCSQAVVRLRVKLSQAMRSVRASTRGKPKLDTPSAYPQAEQQLDAAIVKVKADREEALKGT